MFSRPALAAVILAAVCAVSVNAVAVDRCSRTYTVVPGDTCDGISAKENVSTFQLASVNKGIIDLSCSSPPVGETLCLGNFGQVCRETHVVAAGDTCGSIAAGAGTTVDLVLANNPNVDKHCLNIYPGEVLCTADFVVPASGSSAANLNTAVSSICAPRCCNFVCQP